MDAGKEADLAKEKKDNCSIITSCLIICSRRMTTFCNSSEPTDFAEP